MEIKGNPSYLGNNRDFNTIKGLFDENCKLSSKSVISTTAPACWEGKCFEIKIETDDGTPVTFLCDVPNKPNESGTPETAWYVPEEQLSKMLDTNIFDLIKEDKFQGAYIDRDNDGNAEFSFGGYCYGSDDAGFYTASEITVDENSNGNPEYKTAFYYDEAEGGFNIKQRNEQFDEDDDGKINTYNEYSKGVLKTQETYADDESVSSRSEWNENGQLAYKAADNNADGIMDLYESHDDNGELKSELEYIYDADGKITMQYTGSDNNTDNRIDFASVDFSDNENLVKEMYDTDGDGEWDHIAEHSWSEKGNVKICKSLYDEDNDGVFEYSGKRKIEEHEDGRKTTTDTTYLSKDGFAKKVKEFFGGLFE